MVEAYIGGRISTGCRPQRMVPAGRRVFRPAKRTADGSGADGARWRHKACATGAAGEVGGWDSRQTLLRPRIKSEGMIQPWSVVCEPQEYKSVQRRTLTESIGDEVL